MTSQQTENAADAKPQQTAAKSTGVLVVSGVAVAGGAVGAAVSLTALDQSSRTGPGPGFMPAVVFTALALCGAACAVRQWRALRALSATEPAEEADEPTPVGGDPPASWWRPLAVAGLLVAYLLAIPWLGFLGATFAFSTGTLVVVGHRWLRAAIEAACIAVAAWTLFVWLLQLPLPDWVRI